MTCHRLSNNGISVQVTKWVWKKLSGHTRTASMMIRVIPSIATCTERWMWKFGHSKRVLRTLRKLRRLANDCSGPTNLVRVNQSPMRISAVEIAKTRMAIIMYDHVICLQGRSLQPSFSNMSHRRHSANVGMYNPYRMDCVNIMATDCEGWRIMARDHSWEGDKKQRNRRTSWYVSTCEIWNAELLRRTCIV